MEALSDIGIATKMTGGGFVGSVGKNYFPDPFLDMASLEMPKSLANVLRWAEFLWLKNGTYRMACERVVRYFITKIEIEDVDDESSKKYRDFLDNILKCQDMLSVLGDDFLCYGNSFSSLIVPFERYLECNACKFNRPIQKCEYEFTKDYRFKGFCPQCKKIVEFDHRDRRSSDDKKFKVVRWSPHYMLLRFNEATLDTEWRYRIPEEVKRKVRAGDKFYLATTPWEIIDCIKNDKLFKFHDQHIYHMKEPQLAGLRTFGWGIPRMISNFTQAYYIQVLKRYNEALAIDYIVPFRVLTPAAGNSRVGDPLLHQNLGTSKSMVMQMIAEHRKDPATWHYMPFPMDYKAIGGEGTQMTPFELINTATDEMLNGIGVPADLYKGSLQLQAAPVALRLFQQTWPQITSAFVGWLNWVVRQVAYVKNWEPCQVSLTPITMADDIEKKQILLQLAAAQQVSKGTAFSGFGIDMQQELRRIYDEERQKAELEREFQREEADRQEMEQQVDAINQAGAMPPGGAPMGGMSGGAMGGAAPAMPSPMGQGMTPGGNTKMTPEQMMTQADQLARNLLSMPYEARKSQMLQLKQSDEALHALVKSKMEKVRQEAGNMGKAQLQQQGAPGMGGM